MAKRLSQIVVRNIALVFLGIAPLMLVTFYFGQRSVIDSGIDFYPAEAERSAPDQATLDALRCFTDIYVPAYSHIYWEEGQGVLLSVTLSLRNTSSDTPVVILSGAYYDTAGRVIESEGFGPYQLMPMETTAHLITESDLRGGAGANFMIRTGSQSPGSPLVIAEAIMIGKTASGTVSFSRPGTVINESCQG